MKRIIRILIVTLIVINFNGCSDSIVLEENTQEIGLSNYKVSYKYLNSDYFKEGYLFEPLYFKDNELYGISSFHKFTGNEQDENERLLYKIDKSGNFKEYENESVEGYLADYQIRTSIEDKNIYLRSRNNVDINYFYSDFENETLKELPWLKEPMESVNEEKENLKILNDETIGTEIVFEEGHLRVYEFNSKYLYDPEEKEFENIDNYKFVYYVDLDKEEFYISETVKEEPSFIYYYNEQEKAFIKIKNDGKYEKLELTDGKINFKSYDVKSDLGLNQVLEKYNYSLINNSKGINLKDYSLLPYVDKEGLYKHLIINTYTNEINNYGEKSGIDEEFISINYIIPNSNYFLTRERADNRFYLGVINKDLTLELIEEIDLNLDLYSNEYGPIITLFSDKNGNKILITIKEFDGSLKKIHGYKNIQYIYVDIEEK